MKKILLLQIIFLTSVMAEAGSQRVIGNSKADACNTAKENAYTLYEIFRINSDCACKQTNLQEWVCELRFNYIRKREIKN